MIQPEQTERRMSIVQFFDEAQQKSYDKFKLNSHQFQLTTSRRVSYHHQLADDIKLFKNQVPQIVVTSDDGETVCRVATTRSVKRETVSKIAPPMVEGIGAWYLECNYLTAAGIVTFLLVLVMIGLTVFLCWRFEDVEYRLAG